MSGADAPGAVLRSARTMSLYASVAAALALLFMAGFVSRDAVRAYRDALQPGAIRQSSLEAGIVFQHIEGALAGGVRVEPTALFRQILRERLADFSTLDYIAAVGPAMGWVEISAARTDGTRPSKEQLQSAEWSARGRHVLGAVADFAFPVSSPNGTAWLHVGLSTDAPDHAAAALGFDLAVAIAILVVGLVLRLRALSQTQLLGPLRAARLAVAQGSGRDWNSVLDAAGLDAARLDDSGRFCALLNSLTARINARWQQLIWLAHEVARAGPEQQERAAAILRRVGASARFAADAPLQRAAPACPAVGQMVVFLALMAQTLPLTTLSLLEAALPGGESAVLSALPLSAFAATLPTVLGIAGRAQLSRVHVVFLIGCALATAGNVVGALATTIAMLVIAELMSGAGIGLMLLSCRGLSGSRSGMMISAVIGITCSLGLSAVLQTRIGFPASFVAAAALSGLAGLLGRELILGRASYRRRRRETRAANPAGFVAAAVLTFTVAGLAAIAPEAMAALDLDPAASGYVGMVGGLGASAAMTAAVRRLRPLPLPVLYAAAGTGFVLFGLWSPLGLAALLPALALTGFACVTSLLRPDADMRSLARGAIIGGASGPVLAALAEVWLGPNAVVGLIGALLLGVAAVQSAASINLRSRRPYR